MEIREGIVWMFGIRLSFWGVYVLAPVLLLLFRRLVPRWAPLAILICPVLDLLLFLDEFLHYEARGFGLLFTEIQIIIVAVCALLIRARARK